MLAPGAQIEGYEVVRLAAIGAMCQVYEARSPGAGGVVAFKVLHDVFCADEEVVTRFCNEASLLRTLRHPYIVGLLAAGRLPGGRPYAVLEWLPSNLARALAAAGNPFSARTAARVASQIAAALSALHERGIVHRDLKPDNVLLDDGDIDRAAVRLADLGLAKVRAESGREPLAVEHISTGGGGLVGTWDYMAPEQWIKSKSVDARADVYSLGVLLFQMLAGRLPFVGDQPKDLMALHLFEKPPLSRLGDVVTRDVRDLVGRMLRKLPADRPGMEEVLGALGRIG